jgi:transcriptional regulator with XRE-family HTH domain
MAKGELRAEIGRRLRGVREAKGLTLQQVAKRVGGLHQTYIGRAERGMMNLTLDTLERILSALEVEPYEVFSLRTTKGEPAKAPEMELVGNVLARMSPEVRQLYLALARELVGKRT